MVSFQEFLDADLDRLRRYARLLTGDRDAAHDVLADVLIKAQLRWHRISRMDHPAAYVRSMVTNAHVSDKRRWSSRFISTTSTGELPERAGAAPQHAVDDRAQLDRLLAALPQQQRAAIVLRYDLGLSDQEIAAELRCTTGAVRTYVSRGLAGIRSRGSAATGIEVAPSLRGPVAPLANPVGEHG